MKKVLFLTMILAFLSSGCALLGLDSVKFGNDGCVVWKVSTPDTTKEEPTLKSVVATVCAPTLVEHIRKLTEQIGKVVEIEDGVRCQDGTCGDVEGKMVESMFTGKSESGVKPSGGAE